MSEVRQVALITGCGSGIGLASAVAFTAAGWHVVATVRDLSSAGSLRAALDATATAEVVELDVRDLASVTAAVDDVLARLGRVDVLVCNAGVGYDGTLEELSVDDFSDAMDVNFLGAVRVMKALFPAMRTAGRGRILAVSSMAGVVGMPFNDAYGASKFALEGLFESLHPVAAGVGVEVCLVEPGPVTGEFVGKSAGASHCDSNSPYAAARERFAAVQAGGHRTTQTNDEVAAVLLHVATMDAPALRHQTSESVAKFVALKLKDLDGRRVTGLTRGWI